MTDKTWALGLGLIIFGSVGDFLALGFAAQSIVRRHRALSIMLRHALTVFLLNMIRAYGFFVFAPWCHCFVWYLFQILIPDCFDSVVWNRVFGASQIAPLGSLTLVANVFFAPIMLGEKLETQDWIGTAAIVAGSALAVSFASHEGVSYTCVLLSLFIFGGLRVSKTICYLLLRRHRASRTRTH